MFSITRCLASVAVLSIAMAANAAQAGTLEVHAGIVIKQMVGDEVEVPITVVGGKGVEGVQFVLTFDPKVLEYIAMDAGEIAGAGDVDTKVRQPGTIRVAMFPEKTLDGDGTLLLARFKVIGEDGSEIELTEARAWEFGSKAPLEMLVSAHSGSVSVAGKSRSFLKSLIVVAIVLLLLLLVIRGPGKKKSSNTQGA